MPEKIIVVSMAKNEEDIIESFVRYYMTFADGMVIVDHNSDDDTGKILAALKEEYPSLVVDHLDTVEYIQAEVMSQLLNMAAIEMGADWILPLDVDEFLIPRDGADCRSILSKVAEEVISLNWVDHELVDTETDRDVFLLNRLCNRSKSFDYMAKIIVKGSLVRRAKVRLQQGNHCLSVQLDNGEEKMAIAPGCSDFILAHFPFRSQEQYVSKHAIGWLTSAMKYSVTTITATHWKKAFDKICNDDYVVPKLQDAQFIGKMYDENIALKFTSAKPINVLFRIMKLAESICDKYAKQNALGKIAPVTIIMPVDQDLDKAVDTIGSLLNQTFDKWRLLIIAPDDIDEDVKRAVVECDNRIRIIGINDDVEPEGFVKLINPGRILSPECIEREAVALYVHGEFNINITYSNSVQFSGMNVSADIFSVVAGIDVWNDIKDNQTELTGGISGMLLRSIPQELQLSEVIENYKWKEKEILESLLSSNLLLVFPEPLL